MTANLRLVRELGAGGMGRVWVADHRGLGTQVVVKLMSPELVSDPTLFERFSREAAAAARVKSPHVVQIFDIGVASTTGQPFIVMELLEGEDLGECLLRVGRLTVAKTVEIVTQVANALASAHAKGVVHRDIKPPNIFLCNAQGGGTFAKVLDFGLAKIATATNKLTITGTLMGTPSYMSPEQLRGAKTIDHRTDLWSLGVVTYRALTGKRPFAGETVASVATSVYGDPLPRPSSLRPTLPSAIDEWFACVCQIDPNARFRSAEALATALVEAARGAPPEDPREIEAAPFAAASPVSDPQVERTTTQIDERSDLAPTRVRRR